MRTADGVLAEIWRLHARGLIISLGISTAEPTQIKASSVALKI